MSLGISFTPYKRFKSSLFDDTYANEPGKVDQLEREANEFAQNAMISQKQWQDFKAREKAPDESKIMSFAKKLGISPAILRGGCDMKTRITGAGVNW